MRAVKTRVHPVTVVLVLAVAGLVVFMMYSRRLESTSPQAHLFQQRQPPPIRDAELGAILSPSTSGQGETLSSFYPSRFASPLAVLGCLPGDVLISCNGQPVSGSSVLEAVEALKKDGTPIEMVVMRSNQTTTLKTEEWSDLPAMPPQSAGRESEMPWRRAGRRARADQ